MLPETGFSEAQAFLAESRADNELQQKRPSGVARSIEGFRIDFQGAKQAGKQGEPATPLERSFHTRPM